MLRFAILMSLLLSLPAIAQDDADEPAETAPVESVEEPAEEAASEPAAEPAEEPAGVPFEEPVEEPVDDAGEEPLVAPDDLPAEEPVAEEPTEEPDEDSGLIYEDPNELPEEEPMDAGSDYDEPRRTLPLRAAPDDMPEEEAPIRDPATSTAATYGDRVRDMETGKKVLFGEHRIRLSLARPTFEDLKFYDKLYGDEKNYPMIQADWFAWDWYATLGLSLRFGYYAATGFTSNNVADPDNVSEEEVVKNTDGPTSLTLLPFQLVATAEFTPFSGKWLVIDAWFGYERLYFQEARTVGAGDTAASLFMLQDTADDSDDGTPVNSGWSSGETVGVSANILLNPLDDRGARSLRSIGLGYIYLSPFMEIVSTVNDNDVPFGRSVVGVGFTFESVR